VRAVAQALQALSLVVRQPTVHRPSTDAVRPSAMTARIACNGPAVVKGRAATSDHIDRGMEPEGGRDGVARLSYANALGQAAIRGLATS